MQTKPISPKLLNQLLSDKVQKRFWSKVNVGKPEECWNYPCSTVGGYPRFTIEVGEIKTTLTAHKVAWTMHHRRDVGQGLFVLHVCIGNRLCCNPSHLKEGDQKQNMKDMKDQGRSNYVRGQASGSSKLDDSAILEIREGRRCGQKLSDLAAKFGVDQSNISKIALNKTWCHI